MLLVSIPLDAARVGVPFRVRSEWVSGYTLPEVGTEEIISALTFLCEKGGLE